MRVNASFYVKNTADELVPGKFLVGPNGRYIANPNGTLNTIHPLNNRYFNADGSEIRNGNPGNYLVVPYNYTLGHAIRFASDANNAILQGVSQNAMMVAAFVGRGSQNLQRTYQNADGSMTYAGASVPMFQDAASFHLGFVSDLTGYGPTVAQTAGSAYDLYAQGENWWDGKITARQAWDNNARNMNSIAGGSDFAKGYVPGPNPFKSRRPAGARIRPTSQRQPGSERAQRLPQSELWKYREERSAVLTARTGSPEHTSFDDSARTRQ